ncbi:protein-disulfide reductase DsbD [Nitrosomonadales bacterium]|nr:protein-disulfide reductase DsbD [Nitrosomonadales bacterium]
MKQRLNLFLFTFISLLFCFQALADSQNQSLYNKKNDFLPADKAFKFQIYNLKELKELEVIFDIAPTYYLYKSKIDIITDPFLNLSKDFENGKIKEDEFFGKQEVFYNSTKIKFIAQKSLSKNHKIIIKYQGCSEKGLCYPPISKTISLNQINNNYNKIEFSETDVLVSKISNQNFILTLIGFFFSGLLLSLTPCVLPMLPILSGIIIASNPKKSLPLTLSYVAGVTFTYSLLGIIAGMTGTLLSSSLQNTNFIIFAGFLYFVFALAMFGIFEITMPSNLQNKLENVLQKFKIDKSINVFVLGLISALILSPCVAPPLAAAILYIGKSSDFILGGTSLFSMSLGMCVPLLAIGIFSIKIIPKPGPWMINIKKLLGCVLLAMTIYIIRPLLSELIFFSSLFLIFLVSSFYFIWFNQKIKKLNKIILSIISLAVVVLFNDQTKSISINSSDEQSEKVHHQPFTNINNLSDLKNLLNDSSKKPIMLDFYADWCIACLEYEKFTFSDPDIIKLMESFELIQVDVTQNTNEHQILLKEFDLFGPPGIIFFNSKGNEIKPLRTIGFKNAKDFSKILVRANK